MLICEISIVLQLHHWPGKTALVPTMNTYQGSWLPVSDDQP